MNPLIILVVVSFGLIGFVVGIYLAFRMTRKSMRAVPSVALRQGRNNAFVCLVGVVLVTLGITVAVRYLLEWSFGRSVCAAFVVLWFFVCIAFTGAWYRSKSRAGPLVLDCGQHPTKGLFLFNAAIWSFFAVLSIGAVLVAAFHGENDLLNRIIVALWLASFALYWFIMAFGRLQILENGIWQYVELLKWERIESYDWQGEQKRTLMLKTRTKLPFLGRGALPVPLEHRDAVDELLQKYVPGREVGDASDDAASTSPSDTAP